MTEAEAKAMVGKKARMLDGSYDVPPGTEGTVISAMRLWGPGRHMAVHVEGRTAAITDKEWMWTNDMECNDVHKTVVQICEWDGSLEVL
jgi:hypothetical protein